jgi:hypothetical protein
MKTSASSPTPSSTDTTRVRHGLTGVIAQYIQDLTHPRPAGAPAF